MEEKELRVNTFLKSFFDAEYKNKTLLLNNLDAFYNTINNLKTSVRIFCMEHKLSIDLSRITKMSFLEQESIIDSFFKSIGVNFKLNDIIKDGTLDLKIEQIYIQNFLECINGRAGKKDNHKYVEGYNTGLISDSMVWVHEISHYRNEPDGNRNEISDLLTESISFAMQFIYLDYLKKQGYKYESAILKHEEIDNYNAFIILGYRILKLAIVFDKLGSLSRENYKLLFNDEDYEKCLDIIIDKVLNTGNHGLMLNIFWYNIGYPLAIYMYMRYRENPSFIEQIELLNANLNSNKSLTDMLKIIGINGYNQESIDKIKKSIDDFCDELYYDLESINVKDNNFQK